jgi:multicomponent K+:H+ antiporter subunit D
LALTVQAGPVMRYMEATAQSLHKPQGYIQAVLPAAQGKTSDEGGGQ